MIFVVLYLTFSTLAAEDEFQEITDYNLVEGTQLNCQSNTFKSTIQGNQTILKFTFNPKIGFSQIIYTFNLYEQLQPNVFFKENDYETTYIEEKLLQNSGSFLTCNYLHTKLSFIKLQSKASLNENTVTFTIHKDYVWQAQSYDQFLVSQFKIFVNRCSKYCIKCTYKYDCQQCLPNFELTNILENFCQCPYAKPFLHLDTCYAQCPNGYYGSLNSCHQYNSVTNLFYDNMASQFTLESMNNPTQRVAKFYNGSKIFSGPFFENEAILYKLPQPIISTSTILVDLEILLLNTKDIFTFSLYFDEVVIDEFFVAYYYFALSKFNNRIERCSLNQFEFCSRVRLNFLFKSIQQLETIKIKGNFPIKNQYISWAVEFIRIDKIELPPTSPCLNKLYFGQCVQKCPLVSKEVGQVCESLINQYEFAEIVHTEFDDDNLKSKYIESFDLLNSLMHIEVNFLQIYNNRYIYGGYKKYLFDEVKTINFINPQYKIKIYMKLLLIDPFDASDKMKVYIDDNIYTFSKFHTDAKCFNNIGENGCFQQEEIGSAATDYLIIFEQEILYSKMELKLKISCDSNLQQFYCAYYDLVVLSVLCPINCLQCISETECIQEEYKSVFAKSNILYKCPTQGYFRSNGQCLKCSQDCLECINELECTVCKDNYYLMSGFCICKYNNVIGQYTDCSNSCDGACSTCENSDSTLTLNPIKYKKCSECKLSENKILNEVICVCLDGYFMNKTTFPYQCQTCNYGCKTCEDEIHCLSCDPGQNRVFENKKCFCQQGFYEFNTLSPVCLQCSTNCNTCLNSPDICTSCFFIQNRILTSFNTCDCKPGYFENSNKLCQKCSNICETCSDYAVCLTCAEEQFRKLRNSTCLCIEGFYENNNQCQQCHYSCSQCNLNNYQNQCTTCPITRMKLLKMQKISECICKPGYYDIGDLQCLSCEDLQNLSIDHDCYSKCGDKIIQWNEECDDGNFEPRDGCDQCLLPNSYCFDSKCEECYSNKCIKCVDGYYLNQENKCLQCSDNCLKCQNSENNCTECKYYDSTGKHCIDCSEYIGYTYYNGICYSICGDGILTDSEQCDDNNNINGDGCSQNCLIEEEYKCNHTCQKIQTIQIYLTEDKFDSIYDDKRTIFLYFSHQVEFLSDQISNNLKIIPIQENLNYSIHNITINNDDQQQFQTISIQIIVQLNQSYQAPKFSIELLNNTNIQSFDGFQFKKNNIQIITLIDYQKQELLTVILTKNIINLDSYLLYFLGAFACLAFLLGGLEIFWNLLDTIQLISYLKYYNVTLPYNLDQYFQLFSFAEFDFIKQYFDISPIVNKYADISEPQPKFSKEGYSTLFIINIISVIVVFIITIVTILIIKIILQFLLKITKKSYFDNQQSQEYQKQQQKFWLLKILQKIQNRFLMLFIESKNAILRTFMCTALDLNMAIFLQLNNLKFSNPLFLFSNCLCFFVILIEIKLILQGINIINMVKQYSKDQRKQFDTVYFEGVQLQNGSFSAYLNIINLMKKILFMAFLVTLYNYPLFQIGLTSALSLTFSVFLFQKKSLENRNEQIKQMITEFYLWLTQILIITLLISPKQNWYNEKFLNYIGWAIIGLLNFIILAQLFLDIKQHFWFLQKKYKILTYLKEILSKIFEKESFNETQFTTESEGLGLQKNTINTESSFLQNHNKNTMGQRILISFKLNQPNKI